MWCIQTIDSEFRKRMYDILDLYEEDYDPKRPIVCLDEKPKQLIEDKRKPIPMKPGSPEKYDYEYIRNGTANIFRSCPQIIEQELYTLIILLNSICDQLYLLPLLEFFGTIFSFQSLPLILETYEVL